MLTCAHARRHIYNIYIYIYLFWLSFSLSFSSFFHVLKKRWRDLLFNSRNGLPPTVTQVPYSNLVSDLVSAASFRQNLADPTTHGGGGIQNTKKSAPRSEGENGSSRAVPSAEAAALAGASASAAAAAAPSQPRAATRSAGRNEAEGGGGQEDEAEDWDMPAGPVIPAASGGDGSGSSSGSGGIANATKVSATHVVIADYANDTNEGSLDLKQGDEVVVTDMGEDGSDSEWWYTERVGGGKVMAGWCPQSFLAVVETSNDPDASYITAGATDPDASYITAGATNGSSADPRGTGKFVTALYSSEVSSEAELVFCAGDVIEELQPSDEYVRIPLSMSHSDES